tara:strand:+ start:10880 stop:11395 length:516 start_codon:yes stop_codon:yes gene_type:complete
MNFDKSTRASSDSGYRSERDRATDKMSAYFLTNYRNQQGLLDVKTTSLQQPSTLYKDGHGALSSNGRTRIDNSNRLTNKKQINQLHTRQFAVGPFLGNGHLDVEAENALKISKHTCLGNNYNNQPNTFVPQIESLQESVQDVNNIIESVAHRDWVRGGKSTRRVSESTHCD